MDRRFVAATRRKFEQLASLGETEYYHEAFAGGALNPNSDSTIISNPPTPNGADYVYKLSFPDDPAIVPEIELVVMGWQVHLDHCGGLPGKDDNWIINEFQRLYDGRNFQRMQVKYPDSRVKHIFLIAHLVNGQPAVEEFPSTAFSIHP
jgi:hypothetical protein